MSRIGWLVMTLCLMGAGLAQAQVAVPELVPGGVRIMDAQFPIHPIGIAVPLNPAALQWGSPTRFSYGAVRGDKSDGVLGTAGSYNGSALGIRWVRPQVALGLEAVDVTVEFPGAPPAPNQHKELSSMALSFRLPDWLAWGASSNSFSARDVRPGPVIETMEGNGWTIGLSWRLGETFFLGSAIGHDAADLTGVFNGPVEREYSMYGIGMRGGGTLKWHLEWDSITKDDYKDNGGTIQKQGYGMTLFTAEMILWDWLLSYSSHDVTSTSNIYAIKGSVVDFGYSPLVGFTITWRLEKNDQTVFGNPYAREDSNTLLLTWGF